MAAKDLGRLRIRLVLARISDFSWKQVDTSVLIYLRDYRYQNCTFGKGGLFPAKTLLSDASFEGFLKYPVSLHLSLRDISPARNHSSIQMFYSMDPIGHN